MEALTRRINLLAVVLLAACGGTEAVPEEADVDPVVEGNLWEAGDAEEPPEPGKADAVLMTRAVPKTADAEATQVWAATRTWTNKVDVDFSPYFRRSDNITWNEAFRVFVGKLESTTAVNGYRTYKITNPWGKTLPIAALECAEQAMFLRVAFSSWFNLPFFLEAIDGTGKRMFAGHFGFRTLTGVYSNFPRYKTLYKDYTANRPATWPKDEKLRAKKLGSYDDVQPMIAPNATIGAYLDELHLNKRVGYFTVHVLLWFGSVNLADPANTFHAKPEGIRPSDILLERWQRAGIGHTLNVKTVQTASSGKVSVELASGSMPRRQSVWESPVTSRRYFTNPYTGGPGSSSDGIPYAKLGGGLRRWRTAVVYNNSWVNSVPGDSTGVYINSTNLAAIAARPARFDEILDVADPAARRTELRTALGTTRQYQREHPASCSNREKREALLNDLAQLESEENYWERTETEQHYRSYEDYVFPLLKYERSKTCCWNTTTAAMGQIVVQYNKNRERSSSRCQIPVPFTAANYGVFKAYAAQIGRGADWRDWSEDEPCPQRTVADDMISPDLNAIGYCDIRSYLTDRN